MFNYGGQAVIEGVMMRGSRALAVAVRDPEGEIVIHTEPLDQRIYGGALAKIPFLRGLTLLWDALGLGMKCLLFSADVAMPEEENAGEDAHDIFNESMQWGMILLSLSFAIGLFFLLPAFLADVVTRWITGGYDPLLSNSLEGAVRLALLVGYIWAIGRMPDIRRLFGYHGAEHKTINAYEAGAPLSPSSVATFSLEHPRCGTAFLLTVVIISILLYTLLPPLSLPVRLLSRLVLLPVIAGIAYEFIRFTARHQSNPFIRFITRPNLALQRLTTREPDEDMLAVAIAAFEQVLAYERALEGEAAVEAAAIPEGALLPESETPVPV
ncbi:MAG: DUF1385 domain-containing protein [Candidatus Promineifilaceae bacterium]|nr:DUF1385 domain-containing protein [Candidatus Promineifilaceae bacterium]